MSDVIELFKKVFDTTCKNDVLKIVVIVVACLYLLGFNFNMEHFDASYVNIIINIYIALMCSYAWNATTSKVVELSNKQEDFINKITETNESIKNTVNAADAKDDEINKKVDAMTKVLETIVNDKEVVTPDKASLLLSYRISMVQHEIHTAAMVYVKINPLTDNDFAQLRYDIEVFRHRLISDYGWMYRLLVKREEYMPAEMINAINEAYKKAQDEICELFRIKNSVDDRVFGLERIQVQIAAELDTIFRSKILGLATTASTNTLGTLLDMTTPKPVQ